MLNQLISSQLDVQYLLFQFEDLLVLTDQQNQYRLTGLLMDPLMDLIMAHLEKSDTLVLDLCIRLLSTVLHLETVTMAHI